MYQHTTRYTQTVLPLPIQVTNFEDTAHLIVWQAESFINKDLKQFFFKLY